MSHLNHWVIGAVSGAGVVYFALFAWQLALIRTIFSSGNFEKARRRLSRSRWLLTRNGLNLFDMVVCEYTGENERSVAMANQLFAQNSSLHIANACANAFINGGQYLQALSVGGRHEMLRRKTDLSAWTLLHTNLAEAEYNLGRWDDALARLNRIMTEPGDRAPVVATGERLQRAWILAHFGRCSEARDSFRLAKENSLPPIFRAEYHYTCAHLALAEGQPDVALEAINAGLTLAKRASSRRNGIFLRARALVAGGDVAAALEDFERAAADTYRAQGGDGLLAWGDLLHSLGRSAEARAAWQLTLERDPQSNAAHLAKLSVQPGSSEMT